MYRIDLIQLLSFYILNQGIRTWIPNKDKNIKQTPII